MPSNTTKTVVPSPTEKAEKVFRVKVLAVYELDDEFINNLCKFFTETVEAHLAELTSTPKTVSKTTSGKKTTKRKKSAYNLYVREMMKTPGIQELDHKDKMSAIARQWKELSDEDKTTYTAMADKENNAAAVDEPSVVDEE